MSNNKQSSVELLAIALYEKGFLQGNGDEINDLLEHHKAMHKEEIVKACNLQRNDYKGMPTFNKSGEDYYNETFGNIWG